MPPTIQCDTYLSLLSHLCFHQSSGNGFQRLKLPFLWFIELCSCLSHSKCQLTPQQLPLSKEDSLQPGSLFAQEGSLFTKSKLLYDWRSVSQYVLVWGTPLGPMTRFFFFPSFAGKLLCSSSLGALSDDWSVICSAICQCSESRRTHNHTLLSHLRLLGSLSVAYDLQGLRWKYSHPRPHWGGGLYQMFPIVTSRRGLPENTVSLFIQFAREIVAGIL
jgi:hypothetical protein